MPTIQSKIFLKLFGNRSKNKKSKWLPLQRVQKTDDNFSETIIHFRSETELLFLCKSAKIVKMFFAPVSARARLIFQIKNYLFNTKMRLNIKSEAVLKMPAFLSERSATNGISWRR